MVLAFELDHNAIVQSCSVLDFHRLLRISGYSEDNWANLKLAFVILQMIFCLLFPCCYFFPKRDVS